MASDKVIEVLNEIRRSELTASIQYMAHHDEYEHLDIPYLAQMTRREGIGEMKHAEKLAQRVLFLGGRPANSLLHPVFSSPDIKENLQKNLEHEKEAIERLNKAIQICIEEGDHGSRQLLDEILKDEEEHVDELENAIEFLEKMGDQALLLWKQGGES
ncbi:MAG: bacterioferritin [Planctomycetota bacterium]|nr:MAG: bacterioferritin [Planctomycetota bacterium]